jgi:hypothetical protein
MKSFKKLCLGIIAAAAFTLVAGTADAGSYSQVTPTSAAVFVINGGSYLCFSGIAPASAAYGWCLPDTDPAAPMMATIVNGAFLAGRKIAVGCNTCEITVGGDPARPGNWWHPDWVYID